MEKPTTTSKPKNKLFKLLRKAIKNLPRKNKKAQDGNDAQMVKNSSFGEPVSPKISCIGQIKHKKKLAKNIHLFLQKDMCPASRNKGSLMKPTFFLPEAEKIPSNMRNSIHIHNHSVSQQVPGRKSSCTLSEKAPCLNQMRRFASCHGGVLSDFDWKIAQIEADDYMDEWKCSYEDSEDDEEEEDEKFHFSAPLIMVGGRDDYVQQLEPRKEINLWRRRTIDQPKPLQIRSSSTSLSVLRSKCQ